MTKDEAVKILGDLIEPDGGLHNLGHYIAWSPGDKDVTLDSTFTIEELEAIVWWIRQSQVV